MILRIIALIGREGVALDAVVMLIAVEDRGLLAVVVVGAEEVVIIAGRVVHCREGICLHGGDRRGRKFVAQFVEIFFVAGEGELLVVGESVEADILLGTSLRSILEGIRQ